MMVINWSFTLFHTSIAINQTCSPSSETPFSATFLKLIDWVAAARSSRHRENSSDINVYSRAPGRDDVVGVEYAYI